MVREGRDFRVVDAKSGEDITHNVLTQIIMDTETRGETMLPVNFLRHLIGLYGDKMQGLVPDYLEASMAAFRKNQQDVRSAFEGAPGSNNQLAELTSRNMEKFRQAEGAFRTEEHTSELQLLMRISYAVFWLKKKKTERQDGST